MLDSWTSVPAVVDRGDVQTWFSSAVPAAELRSDETKENGTTKQLHPDSPANAKANLRAPPLL